MRVFDFYLLKNLSGAVFFIFLTLIAVIFLTQSLRFLELVIESSASGLSFWILTMLAMPRFFEIIIPLALLIAILFVYTRMQADSEIIAMRSSGTSPISLSRAALSLSGALVIFLLFSTLWMAPYSLNKMQKMQDVIKAQFSNLLFREKVFNQAGGDLTFYVRERGENGELKGLMIHDTRSKEDPPTTIVAKSGNVTISEDGYQIIVYEGSRQQINSKNGALQRLDFDRYTIELPSRNDVRNRWKEPDERTLFELLRPDMGNIRDREHVHKFMVEVHRRIIAPFLCFTYSLIALFALLKGQENRRGKSKRVGLAVLSCLIIQGLFLASYNMAGTSVAGLVLMYLLVFAPIALCLHLLMRRLPAVLPAQGGAA